MTSLNWGYGEVFFEEMETDLMNFSDDWGGKDDFYKIRNRKKRINLSAEHCVLLAMSHFKSLFYGGLFPFWSSLNIKTDVYLL